jgi:hypothetical protein
LEINSHKGDMDKSDKIKPWEVVLIAVGLFLVCSTSLYWYDRFNLTRFHKVEDENRMTWEKNTQKWQKDATDNINGLRESQQQVLDVLNTNFANGRLIMPQKEKK